MRYSNSNGEVPGSIPGGRRPLAQTDRAHLRI
jgi:hypothetical protein